MEDIIVKPKQFQQDFLLSSKRYPALVSAIGTGKTYMLLLKLWKFCLDYSDSLALIVRKEFTDLRDSTIKDFTRYFGVEINADKEYHFENGSVLMFRHGAEISVLKNINLSLFGIEQAEEFETEETFIFLRDRLRRTNSPYRQGCIIANANGHNWIWRLWLNNPPSEDYFLSTANTFENADNLPADFIADLKRMEVESPNHYKQYVLNSFEEIGADDVLLSADSVYQSPKIIVPGKTAFTKKILGVDVARFGDDETVFTIIETSGATFWEQIYQDTKRGKDTMWTTGQIIDLQQRFNVDLTVVDEGGIGGGVIDRLNEMRRPVVAFDGACKPKKDRYYNVRAEGFFALKELFDRNHLKLINDPLLMEQLLSIKFQYKSNGQLAILSKDVMRKEGLKSPDRADALMMAASQIDNCLSRKFEKEEFYPKYGTSDDAMLLGDTSTGPLPGYGV